jgi:PAS domain S-box-containing protein
MPSLVDPGSTELDHLRAILDGAPNPCVSIDSRRSITRWNRAAEAIFGWSAEEVVGRALADTVVPPEAHEQANGVLEALVRAPDSSALRPEFESEGLHRDGHRFPIEVKLSATRVAGELTVTAFIRDITYKRQVEERLRQAEAIIKWSDDGIYSTTIDGMIDTWNPAAERLYGYTAEQAIGQSVGMLAPPGQELEHRSMLADMVQSKQPRRVEVERIRRDGVSVWVALSISALRDADGAAVGALGIARDVSDRRVAEADLTARIGRLKELAFVDVRPEPDRATESVHAEALDVIVPVLKAARELLDMDVSWVAEFADGQHVFRDVDGDAASFGVKQGDAIPLSATYCLRMLNGDIPNVVPDVRNDPRVRDMPVTAATGTGAYVGVPLRLSDGGLYGTLCCASHAAKPGLDASEVQFMHVLARLVTDVIERQRLEHQNKRLRGELTGISALLAALDARDSYTGEHSRQVVDLSRAVAEHLGVREEEAAAVEQVALLHDIGKVGIPDAVLQKPGRLNEQEWEMMRQHPAIGARMVASIDSLAHLVPAVRAEHERWDGGGYPDGLAGSDIPLAARITLACDAYHAMTSDRPYRRAMSQAEVRAELRKCAGSQFDPDVVDALLAVLD